LTDVQSYSGRTTQNIAVHLTITRFLIENAYLSGASRELLKNNLFALKYISNAYKIAIGKSEGKKPNRVSRY
jgi:hypothetical protein